MRETPDGLRLQVHIQPNGKKNEVLGEYNGALKIRIHAPPLEGKANEELVKFLAKVFLVKRSDIKIIRGDQSRSKLMEIKNIGLLQAQDCLQKIY